MYGQAPHPSGDWGEVPFRRLKPYVQKMAQIEAERSLSQVNAIAAGFGSMEERDLKRFIDTLRFAAAGGRKPKSEKATPVSLGQMRIQFEEV